MTTITMQLPDDLVAEARQSGVLNEQALVELCSQFLRTHISLTKKIINTKSVKGESIMQETLGVEQLINKMDFQTDKCLSVEEMNADIGKLFKHWES